jgi:CDP-glucose 4,6-dehydratase
VDVPTNPSLFEAAQVARDMTSLTGDVRDAKSVLEAMRNARAQIVIHLAAQSLVRRSYASPVDTFAANVMGTVNVLEAARQCPDVQAIVVVTSDKCYENRDWEWGYRESDAMGGHDPYSASKGCAELVTAAYRRSFFAGVAGPRVASGRAGNVIGGGDWAEDRLIPDMVRAFQAGTVVRVRNPKAVRPWQHVLEPLRGYLTLALALAGDNGPRFASGWNFGPRVEDARSVAWMADTVVRRWGSGASWELENKDQPHEAVSLSLDCSKACRTLGWTPVLDLETTLDWTVRWYRDHAAGDDARDLVIRDIRAYQAQCGGGAT